MTRLAPALALALLLPLVGCADPRPVVEGTRACASWRERVGPLLETQCASCHGGSDPAGMYDVTSYRGALAGGSDEEPNARAGDADSAILRAIDPALAARPHEGFAAAHATLREWVLSCNLSYFDSALHAGGIMNPADPAFHGAVLRGSGYDFDKCTKCHGDDFAGGTSKASCKSCHAEGPTGCTTCHGAPPATGAHRRHVAQVGLDCAACHVKPADWKQPGHVFTADGTLDEPPAEVTFDEQAARSLDPAKRAGPPEYDRATRSCKNVYCHGGALGDGKAEHASPAWSGGPDQVKCGGCHGLPPSSHAQGDCASCHPKVVDKDRAIIDPTRHLDGKLSLGDESGKCGACHKEVPDSGAHTAHLTGAHGLRGPLACGDCHLVPKLVTSPGHLDSELPVEVFPVGAMGFSSIATADGASPAWDRAAGKCGNVYCHGGGKEAANDKATGLARTPSWSATGVTYCGSCHGIPPVDADHTPQMGLGTCATCHPATIDRTGALIVKNGASTHVNGVVDVQ